MRNNFLSHFLAGTLLTLLFPIILSAQGNCSDADILSIKGNWKKNNDATMQYNQEQGRVIRSIDSISVLFQASYPQPKGMVASWYRSMSSPSLPGGLLAYSFNSLYFSWVCDPNRPGRLLQEKETGTWIWVHVNSLGTILNGQYNKFPLKVNAAYIYALPIRNPDTWNGYDVYASRYGANAKCIVLTRRGRLPWRPVSQEEYLRSLRVFAEGKRNAGSGIAAASSRTSILTFYDQQTRNIDDYLAHTDPATLRQAAILPGNMATPIPDSSHFMPYFDGRFGNGTQGGRMLVTIDPEYFDRQLPLYQAQVMVLEWMWEKNPAATYFKQQFEADFPVQRLQAMLDR